MGRNRWRGEWELPGGLIEPEETSRRAALRELGEETGCVLPDEQALLWVGFATFNLIEPRRRELAAVYRVHLKRRPPTHSSYELPEVAWMDLAVTNTPADVAPLDFAIARYCAGA